MSTVVRWYVLDAEHRPIPSDTIKAARFFECTENRRVAWSEVADVRVSTVFLGFDHRRGGDGPPILFETMVLRGDEWTDQERYCTWDEAIAGHERAVQREKTALS